MVGYVIGYHWRYMSPSPDPPNIGGMWKCCDKVENFDFIFGFLVWFGCANEALNIEQILIRGRRLYLCRNAAVVY